MSKKERFPDREELAGGVNLLVKLAMYMKVLDALFEQDDKDDTLFVQLTRLEMGQIAFAFFCASELVGDEVVDGVRGKLIELAEAQGWDSFSRGGRGA